MNEIAIPHDWWSLLNEHWENLLEIIGHHIDFNYPAFDPPGDSNGFPTGRKTYAEMEHLRKTEDPRLARYLGAAWCLASEAYAWSVPSWGVLCDLLSEEYVLDEGAAPWTYLLPEVPHD